MNIDGLSEENKYNCLATLGDFRYVLGYPQMCPINRLMDHTITLGLPSLDLFTHRPHNCLTALTCYIFEFTLCSQVTLNTLRIKCFFTYMCHVNPSETSLIRNFVKSEHDYTIYSVTFHSFLIPVIPTFATISTHRVMGWRRRVSLCFRHFRLCCERGTSTVTTPSPIHRGKVKECLENKIACLVNYEPYYGSNNDGAAAADFHNMSKLTLTLNSILLWLICFYIFTEKWK